MEPVKFPQSNKTLNCPDEMGKDCGDLPIFTDGRVCVSVWQMTFMERLRALFYGKVWLYVWTGQTQPPVGMIIDKTVFLIREEGVTSHAAKEETSKEKIAVGTGEKIT